MRIWRVCATFLALGCIAGAASGADPASSGEGGGAVRGILHGVSGPAGDVVIGLLPYADPASAGKPQDIVVEVFGKQLAAEAELFVSAGVRVDFRNSSSKMHALRVDAKRNRCFNRHIEDGKSVEWRPEHPETVLLKGSCACFRDAPPVKLVVCVLPEGDRSPPALRCRPDADGTFRIDGIPPGRYGVRILSRSRGRGLFAKPIARRPSGVEKGEVERWKGLLSDPDFERRQGATRRLIELSRMDAETVWCTLQGEEDDPETRSRIEAVRRAVLEMPRLWSGPSEIVVTKGKAVEVEYREAWGTPDR